MIDSRMSISEYTVVLYKGQPALVTGFDTGKITIQTTGGSIKVREKDIEVLHKGPVKSLESLTHAVVPDGNLCEAFEFFQNEQPSFSEVAELIWGTYPAEAAWVIWKALTDSPFFECTGPTSPIRIRSTEEVLQREHKDASRKAAEQERQQAISRIKDMLAGNATLDRERDGKYLQDVEALALLSSDKSKTLKEAGIAETPQEAHRVLLQTGYWEPWKNPWPSRHGMKLTSARAPIDPPDNSDNRLDLTHLSSWAIDNEWSADPDDALSVDGQAIWIHIADPSSTVTPDSPADCEARARGATLYIPEGPARMLSDEALSWYALGLSDVSRALSFRLTFTDTGAIDEVAIHRTFIRVTRLTYEQASAKKNDPLLAPLFDRALRNIERRHAAGSIQIDLPEVYLAVHFSQDKKPEVSFTSIVSEASSDMVREMMLLAGEAAARFAFKHKIPFQYVSQERPDIPHEIPEGLAGQWRKRRSMRGRKVGTIPADHAGLGLGMYSQVTSPLRRYGDLVAHQQIGRFLDGKPLLDSDDMLMRIAQGDSAARETTLSERESNAHWTLYFLESNPDWKGQAIIVDIVGSQAVILIPELAMESKIATPSNASRNDTITVRASGIQLWDQSVVFIPVEQ